MKKLEDKIKEILSAKGLTIQRLATSSKISEPTIHAIFNRNDAKLSQLHKIAEALETPLSYFLPDDVSATSISQTGFANVAGTNNKQKIMPGAESTGRTTLSTNTPDLAAKLADCEKDKSMLTRELEVTRELVRAKDEMILLLRGPRDNPN